jgi:hypothetical protein
MNLKHVAYGPERVVLALVFLFVFCLFSGCQRLPSSQEAGLDPKTKQTTDTARVICGGKGVSVLTRRVESQPDGVHLEISNLLEGRADLSVSHSGGGMGWSVPTGESKRVANVPPGKVEIDCYPSWTRGRLPMMEVETIEVLAGDSGYKSTKLDCPREESKKIKPYTKEEMKEHRGDPIEIFRRSNSNSLRKGDVVEDAGNTRSRGERTVRVVRDGKVVATAHYLKFSTGWMEATEENCVGF